MNGSNLRQRRGAPETDDRALNLESIQRLQEQVGPIFVQVATLLEKVQPVIAQVSGTCRTIWDMLQPYHPHELFSALYGFFLVFFGGVYMTLVASVEAAHQFGWPNIKVSVKALYQEWTIAYEAFERDNKVSHVEFPNNASSSF